MSFVLAMPEVLGSAATDLAALGSVLPRRGRRRFRVTRLDQRVQMTPHTGGRQAQPVTDLAGGDRSGFQQQAHNGPTSVTVRDCRGDSGRDRRDFHNISVTKFR